MEHLPLLLVKHYISVLVLVDSQGLVVVGVTLWEVQGVYLI